MEVDSVHTDSGHGMAFLVYLAKNFPHDVDHELLVKLSLEVEV